jgi:hypothetical protein
MAELHFIEEEIEELHHYCIRCLAPSYSESDPDICANCIRQLDEILEKQNRD